jgi:hypothetical protein
VSRTGVKALRRAGGAAGADAASKALRPVRDTATLEEAGDGRYLHRRCVHTIAAMAAKLAGVAQLDFSNLLVGQAVRFFGRASASDDRGDWPWY